MFNNAFKILVDSLVSYPKFSCDFAFGFAIEVQLEDAACTLVFVFFGHGLGYVLIEQLLE